MKKILVLCTGNSCRSQIAEGYLRFFAGGKASVYSAGVETHGINPKAISIMGEDGIDISGHTSNNIDEYTDIAFDYVITVCDSARETCPYFSGKVAHRIHMPFEDPASATGTNEEKLRVYRQVRDQIREEFRKFYEEIRDKR